MSKFLEAVKRNVGDLTVDPGACPGCDGCGLSDVHDMNHPAYELAGEPSFSWRRCDGCGSRLGGDRYPAHCVIDGHIEHMSICVDCVMFHANGDEPEPGEWR